MIDWEYLFEDHILARGSHYFDDDRVHELNISDDRIEASVIGDELYRVNIAIDSDSITELSCTCPYAANGQHCKHMAALLYYVEDQEEITVEPTIQADIERIVSNTSTETVKYF